MTNHNDSSRFGGTVEQTFDEEQDLALQAAVLAVDFPKRLERLHEVSGLTWPPSPGPSAWTPSWSTGGATGWSHAAGPCTPSFRFAARMPGGMAILVTESFQMSFFKEHS